MLHDNERALAPWQRARVERPRDDEARSGVATIAAAAATARGGRGQRRCGAERLEARGLGAEHRVAAPEARLDEEGLAGLRLVLVSRGPAGARDELLASDALAELGLEPGGGGGESGERRRGRRRRRGGCCRCRCRCQPRRICFFRHRRR